MSTRELGRTGWFDMAGNDGATTGRGDRASTPQSTAADEIESGSTAAAYNRRRLLGGIASATAGVSALTVTGGRGARASRAGSAASESSSDARATVAPSPPTPLQWLMDGYDPSNTRHPTNSLAVTGELSEVWDFNVNVDHTTGERYKSGRLSYTSPVVADGLVVFGDSSIAANQDFVHAVDVDTGEHVWRTPMAPMESSVAVGDGRVYAAGLASFVIGLDLADGSELWRFGTAGDVTASPKYHDGLVYVGCNDGRFYAVNPEEGFREWRYDTTADADGLEFYGAPVIRDGVVYANTWAGSDGSAFLYGFDAVEGDVVFRDQVSYGTGGGAGPLAAGADHLFVPDAEAGELVAYDLDSHEVAWRKEDFQFGPHTGPAVADCRVVATGANGTVTAASVDDGEWAWRKETRGPIEAPPMVANGTVYVTDTEGWLYGFAMLAGSKRFEYDLGGSATTTPRVIDADLLVTGRNRLYRLAGVTKDNRHESLCETQTTAAPATATDDEGTDASTGESTVDATGTQSPAATDSGDAGDTTTGGDDGSTPGFGVVSAVAGIAAGAGIALRRRFGTDGSD
jgi:PGF-CTERM protein